LCIICLAGRAEAGRVVSQILPMLASQVEKPCECYTWLVG
jgi:hypothetical protein